MSEQVTLRPTNPTDYNRGSRHIMLGNELIGTWAAVPRGVHGIVYCLRDAVGEVVHYADFSPQHIKTHRPKMREVQVWSDKTHRRNHQGKTKPLVERLIDEATIHINNGRMRPKPILEAEREDRRKKLAQIDADMAAEKATHMILHARDAIDRSGIAVLPPTVRAKLESEIVAAMQWAQTQ